MNYYNENDPFAAAWLLELMVRGLIPDGYIDTRSIKDVRPGDVAGFTQCHWFAGIGGWSHALRLAGWPEDRQVWTSSPPCQDASVAKSIWGIRSGLRGERTGLAIDWCNLVKAVQPPVVLFENVPGISAWIAEIERSLEGAGYTVSRQDKTSGGIGAPHLRRRVWLAADRYGTRLPVAGKTGPSPAVGEAWRTATGNLWRGSNRRNGGLDDGVSGRMDTVRAYGNAICPQVAQAFVTAYAEARGLNLLAIAEIADKQPNAQSTQRDEGEAAGDV